MATVVADMSMSLDGFVADPSDEVGPLFDWYGNGEVAVPTANPQRWTFRTSAASARYLREVMGRVGAVVTGRRLFDHTGGWDGTHPWGVPVFVVSHSVPEGWPRADAPFTFVTDGLASAVAQAKAVAGAGWVSVAGPNIAQQCLNAGLLDGIQVDLVPVLLGDGIRFFDNLGDTPVRLEGPTVIESTGVTHLYYGVTARADASTAGGLRRG